MNIGFIPIRSGSKGIVNKNIKSFCGKPLIYWTAKALEDSKSIDQFYIALDNDEYAKIVESFGFQKLKIYYRQAKNAQSASSTESVMFEFIKAINLHRDDNFFLVQATNPFLKAQDIDTGYSIIKNKNKDSLLSCVKTKRFLWSEDGNPINYNYKDRPRRQDFEGNLVENGAFYINSVNNILENENRLSGNIGIYEMPEYTFTEIDEDHDWIIAEQIFLRHHNRKNVSPKIKLFLTDVDGVLTDGGMYYSENGDELKKFNTLDGKAFEILRNRGIKIGIITQEDTTIVAKRAQKLQMDYIYQGIHNKLEILLEICKKEKISFNEVAYIGDDIGDQEVLKATGIKACPQNAVKKIKNIPGIIQLQKKGGEGCIREFLEFLLDEII